MFLLISLFVAAVKDGAVHETVRAFPLIKYLLPSFCATASVGFIYKFYLAFDYSDVFFATTNYRSCFTEVFAEVVQNQCGKKPVDLTFVQVEYSGTCTCENNVKCIYEQFELLYVSYWYLILSYPSLR